MYFDNTVCVNCGYRLGFIPEKLTMSALEPAGDRQFRALARPERRYMFCDNAANDVCNWLLPVGTGQTMCEACRHNRSIPDLSGAANLSRWRKIESAKRYLFYSLLQWRLPLPDRAKSPNEGLAFDFLSDVVRVRGGKFGGSPLE